MVDKGSATAPVFLYGCERRDDRQPYALEKLIEIDYPVIDDRVMDPMISDITNNYYYFDDDRAQSTKSSLWIQELSLHWEVMYGPRTAPIIQKRNYEIRSEYRPEVDKFVTRPEMDFKDNSVYGDLDIRRLNDSETDFYQALLDTLNPKRAESYETWFDVL
ncbi:hypothetical protein EBS02_06215, partial [bacterium]|nr:hypothetical protein [bacterium]